MKLHRRAALWAALFATLAAESVARAEQPIGGLIRGLGNAIRRLTDGDAVEAAVEMEAVAVDAVNAIAQGDDEFTPYLKAIVKVETAYLDKVCGPSAAQLAAIRKAGETRVAALAREMAVRQRRNVGEQGWPDVRRELCDALRKEAEKTLPDDAVKRYVFELAERDAARKEAALGAMVVSIDRSLMLSPAQTERITTDVRKNWSDQWSRSLQTFLYTDYMPMPEKSVLAPALTKRQKDVWDARPNHGSISFGWQADLGLLFNEFGMEDQEPLSDDDEPAVAEVPAGAKTP